MGFELLSKEFILQLAGDQSFKRGKELFNTGKVGAVAKDGTVIRSSAFGTDRYELSLWEHGGNVEYRCSCPYGIQGNFCKHLVGLCFKIDFSITGIESPIAPGLESRLDGLQKKDLIGLIMKLVSEDYDLTERIEIFIDSLNPKAFSVKELKSYISKCFGTSSYIDYRSAPKAAIRMQTALTILENLPLSEIPDQVLELAEFTLKKANKRCLNMDDSDGHMSPVFEKLEELHLRAAFRSSVDPESLAKRLYKLAKSLSFGQFNDCLEKYREPLGDIGRGVFQKLVEADFNMLPVKKARVSRRMSSIDVEESEHRSTVTHFAEQLAEQSGDTDALIAVYTKDLSHSFDYKRIVDLLIKAERPQEALEWALRCQNEFRETSYSDFGVREILLKAYVANRLLTEALTFTWDCFQADPSVVTYQQLCNFSKQVPESSITRDAALAFLEAQVKDQSFQKGKQYFFHVSRAAVLTQIYLVEKNYTRAWELAQLHGASDDQWRQLAEWRAETNCDAAQIYIRFFEQKASQSIPSNYEAAVHDLARAITILETWNKSHEATLLAKTIAQKFKAKRRLQRELRENQTVARALETSAL